MRTTESQGIILIRNFDGVLPSILPTATCEAVGIAHTPIDGTYSSVFPVLNAMLPGYEVVPILDEESGNINRTLGDLIPNATYRQRLECHDLTPHRMHTLDRIQRILGQTPMIYDPNETDHLGMPVEIDQDMIGVELYKVNITRRRGIDDELRDARKLWQAQTGNTLVYPEGSCIEPVEASVYLKPKPVQE